MPEELALAAAVGLAALGTQHAQGCGSQCWARAQTGAAIGASTGRSCQGPTGAQGSSSTYLLDLGPVLLHREPVHSPCDSQEAAKEARSESALPERSPSPREQLVGLGARLATGSLCENAHPALHSTEAGPSSGTALSEQAGNLPQVCPVPPVPIPHDTLTHVTPTWSRITFFTATTFVFPGMSQSRILYQLPTTGPCRSQGVRSSICPHCSQGSGLGASRAGYMALLQLLTTKTSLSYAAPAAWNWPCPWLLEVAPGRPNSQSTTTVPLC